MALRYLAGKLRIPASAALRSRVPFAHSSELASGKQEVNSRSRSAVQGVRSSEDMERMIEEHRQHMEALCEEATKALRSSEIYGTCKIASVYVGIVLGVLLIRDDVLNDRQYMKKLHDLGSKGLKFIRH